MTKSQKSENVIKQKLQSPIYDNDWVMIRCYQDCYTLLMIENSKRPNATAVFIIEVEKCIECVFGFWLQQIFFSIYSFKNRHTSDAKLNQLSQSDNQPKTKKSFQFMIRCDKINSTIWCCFDKNHITFSNMSLVFFGTIRLWKSMNYIKTMQNNAKI